MNLQLMVLLGWFALAGGALAQSESTDIPFAPPLAPAPSAVPATAVEPTVPVAPAAPAVTDTSNNQLSGLAQFQPSDQEMMSEAAAFIRQQNPGRAIMILTDLLRYYPNSQYQEEVLYRIAACYRDLGRFDEARQTLDLQEKKFPQGQWLPAATMLRGEMLAADKKWPEALPYLQKAVATATTPDIKLRANYLMVLAGENLGQQAMSRDSLEFLVKQETNNPYLDYARVRLAVLESNGGSADRAMSLFKTVLSTTQDAASRGEAGVRAGNLAYSQNHYQEAIGYYDVVRRTDTPDFWQQLANLGLIQTNFAEKNYASVIQAYNESKPHFPDNSRAEVLFLVAESYRLTKQNEQALATYQLVLDQFPNDADAEPSSWGRILLLKDGADSDAFLAETARFLGRFPKSTHVPLVQAMRADTYYTKGDYKTAAPMYAEVLKNPDQLQLPDSVLAGLYYRTAYAWFSLQNYQAARSWLTTYLSKFPKGENGAEVLWLKGQTELEAKEPAAALASWQQLIDGYPKFSQRETALWQAAMLAGNQKDYARMDAWLGKLVREFPQSTHLGEAYYWQAVAREAANDYAGAMTQWEAARKQDPGHYYAAATQHIIRILLKNNDVAHLRSEVDAYDQWHLKNPQDPGLNLDVYEWLGQEMMDGSQAAASEPYLRRVLTASQDSEQRRRVQLRLAMLMSQQQNWAGAVREWTTYRANFASESNRSAVLEPLAQAYIGLANYDMANKLADQILRQNPEGEYNARGRILLGDIAFAKKQYDEAAKMYSAVALLIDDQQLTPEALSKAAKSWSMAGNKNKAAELLARLKQQYPTYQ